MQSGYRLPQPVPGASSDEAFVDACVEDLRDADGHRHRGRRRLHDRRADPGRRRLRVPPDGLLAAFKEVLDEHGTLFISDEVQTGWGRTGEHFWGIEASGVVPDAMTFAKGLARGWAIGGVVARGDLMDGIQGNSISTFGGNPVATAAAKAVLDYVLSHDLQANAAKLGAVLRNGLLDAQTRLPVIGEVRGKGLMIGIELVAPDGSPAPAAAAHAMEETRKGGLLVGKGGLYGNVLRLAPPMSLTAEEADEGLGLLVAALETVDAQVRG